MRRAASPRRRAGSLGTAAAEGLLWTVALVGLAAAARAVTAPRRVVPAQVAALALAEPAPTSEDTLAAAADVVVARDPFRTARHPALADFQINPAPFQPAYAAPVSTRPALVLKGVLGGPPWQAYLDGVPGRDGGVLVARGDTLLTPAGPLRVRAVGRDTVVVQSADTTWRLTVKRAWPQ